MRNRKCIAILISFVILAVIVSGCSASYDSAASDVAEYPEAAYDYADDMAYYDEEYGLEEPKAEETADDASAQDTDASSSEIADAETRKLIYNGSMTVETLDFDGSAALIEKMVSELQGYVESSSVSVGGRYYYEDGSYSSLRSAVYTLRIPSDKFKSFMDGGADLGNVKG
jgi:hypothetical protein